MHKGPMCVEAFTRQQPVSQAFLDDMENQLKTDPNFKGQLGTSKC